MKYQFDEKNHLHSLGGKPLIGTSTLIKDVMPPFLAKWGAQCAVDYTKKEIEACMTETGTQPELSVLTGILDNAVNAWTKVRKEAADKGTDMHAELEKYVKSCIEKNNGNPDWRDRPDMEEVHAVKKFRDWACDNVERFTFSEGYCYSDELWVGGICDAGAVMKDGKFALFDFKSSKDAYFNQYIQVAGYSLQIAEHGVFDKDGNAIPTTNVKAEVLYIVPFGAKDVTPRPQYDVEGLQQAFKSCVGIYKSLQAFSNK